MRFSTKGEYGLRLAVNLAKSYPTIKSVGDIAVEENISLKYLERLIGELRKNNIVKSFKGKDGGYVLARNPQKIMTGEVIEIMEGPLTSKCAKTHCQNVQKCPSSFVWIKLGKQIRKTLYEIKLSDLI
jgi:Rrf2 family transcriptional regulator, cysteine metabolism repressor